MVEEHLTNLKDIAAVIACRGGSLRVTNKNIRPFADSTLLEIKIKQLQSVVDKVYVNSDNQDILNVASKVGAIAVERDPHYATNSIPMNEVYKNVTENVPHEHILYAHVTSPLIKTSTIKECVDIYNNLSNGYDSLCTVQTLKKFTWYEGKAINYNADQMPRSQDLPDYHMIAFAINILPKNILISYKNIVTKNYYPFILDDLEAVDIDDALEFEIAEYLYKQYRL